jgi:hypothetical protein
MMDRFQATANGMLIIFDDHAQADTDQLSITPLGTI